MGIGPTTVRQTRDRDLVSISKVDPAVPASRYQSDPISSRTSMIRHESAGKILSRASSALAAARSAS